MAKHTPQKGRAGMDGVLNFLRCNEASLSAMRPCRPTPEPATLTGWAASKQKLIVEAVQKVAGNERALAMEQRWSRILGNMVLASPSKEFRMLVEGLLPSFQELAQHPFGSLVLRCAFSQIPFHLQLPNAEALAVKLKESTEELLESGVWAQMLTDTYGTEVATSMLFTYAGFLPPPPQFQRHGKADSTSQKLPARADDSLPDCIPDSFNSLVQHTKALVRDKPHRFLTEKHCTRVLHVILQVLQEVEDSAQSASLIRSMLSAPGKLKTEQIHKSAQLLLETDSGASLLVAAAGVAEGKVLAALQGLARKEMSRLLFGASGSGQGLTTAAAAEGSDAPRRPSAASASPRKLSSKLNRPGAEAASGGCGGGEGACKVSFVLLVSGDSAASSFKPAKDATQWWGRRDALCRSVAAALWRGEGMAWAEEQGCVLLFDDLGTISMTARATKTLRVPSERALVKAWRDASLGASGGASGIRFKPPPSTSSTPRSAERSQQEIEHAFLQILKPLANEDACAVLLHEDYPVELPVFGPSISGKHSGPVRHAVFILGTVRDMTEAEQQALVAAARQCGVRLVGCNLGRTAEFTSKIIQALNGHAISGRLGLALAALVEMGATDLQKLPPRHRAMATDPPTSSKKKRKRTEAAGAPQIEDGGDGAMECAGVRSVHVVAVVDMELDAVSSKSSARNDMYTLSQVVVCSLWRSNLAEILHRGLLSTSLQCELSLVFACGALVHADQGLVAHLASEQKAAPSEHQILSILEAAKDPDWTHPGVRVVHSAGKKGVRKLLRSMGEDCVIIDVSRVVPSWPSSLGNEFGSELDVAQMVYSQSCGCSGASPQDGQETPRVGGKRAREADGRERKVAVVVRCGDGDASCGVEVKVAQALRKLQRGALECRVITSSQTLKTAQGTPRGIPDQPETIVPTIRRVRLGPRGSEMSPQAAVSLVQHWAYHQRLGPVASELAAMPRSPESDGEQHALATSQADGEGSGACTSTPRRSWTEVHRGPDLVKVLLSRAEGLQQAELALEVMTCMDTHSHERQEASATRDGRESLIETIRKACSGDKGSQSVEIEECWEQVRWLLKR